MSDMKLLQLCACVENFHRNWRIISCSIAPLSLSMSDGNCDELFEDLYSVIVKFLPIRIWFIWA